MKKISILALHLGYGGIEKSIASLANLLSEEYKVEIITTYKLYNKSPFVFNDNVSIKYLITNRVPNREKFKKALKKGQVFSLVKETYYAGHTLLLRKQTMINAIKECDSDIIISTRDLFNTWLGKFGNKMAFKIGWEHNHHRGNMEYAKKVVKSAWNLDKLVLVSDSLRGFYKKQLKDSKCKCVFIPNMIDSIPLKNSKLSNKRIISIGRLAPEKGFVDLIEVFKLVNEKRSDWELDIVGDGAQKNLIGDLIYQYDLNDKIKLHGFQDKEYINKLLSSSSIYAMTSFTESFGIVLVEAMSYGIPCVAFSSAEGANDLIINNKNGYLIGNRDKEEMAKKIIELIDGKKLRQELGLKGKDISLNFTPDKVKDLWMALFKKRG